MARKTSRRFARRGGDHEIEPDINTTPLIDVMLVLLVMLIITIPLQLHAVNIELPVGTSTAALIKPEKIQIDIDARDALYWQGMPTTAEELGSKLLEASRPAVQPEISLRPDKDCSYAAFAHVLSSSRRMGLSKIAVIGSEQFVQ